MSKKFELWLNIKITDLTLVEKLEAMRKADKRTRSDFVRLLIAKEFDERAAIQAQGVDAQKAKAAKVLIALE